MDARNGTYLPNHDHYAPPRQLLGPDGTPITSAKWGKDGFPLPHVLQMGAIIQSGFEVFWDRWDEARRHSRENALAMEKDCFLQSLLQERALATSTLKWHIHVDDEKDPYQKALKDGMQRVLAATPWKTRMHFETIKGGMWYGRSANQRVFEWREISVPVVQAMAGPMGAPPLALGAERIAGPMPVERFLAASGGLPAMSGGGLAPPAPAQGIAGGLPGAPAGVPAAVTTADERRRCLVVKKHQPVHGDSIYHKFDGTPVILTYSPAAQEIAGAETTWTTAGSRAVVLKGTWRERFVVYSHESKPAEFFDYEKAEAMYGAGLRDVSYWSWWMKTEYLEWFSTFFERFGLGLRLWGYEAGNTASYNEVFALAKEASRRVNILVPIFGGKSGQQQVGGLTSVETPIQGADAIRVMLEYFDTQMERYFVGQSMSGGADNESGLGGTGRAKFAANTKWQCVKYDAENLADCYTADWVRPVQRWTYPECRDVPLEWRFNVPDPDNAEKLAGVQAAISFGVDFKKDEVRALTGMSDPQPGDDVVGGDMMMQPLPGQEGEEVYEDEPTEDDDWEGFEDERGRGARHRGTGEERFGDEPPEDEGDRDRHAAEGDVERHLPTARGGEPAPPVSRGPAQVAPALAARPTTGPRATQAHPARPTLPRPHARPLQSVGPRWEAYQTAGGEVGFRHNTTGQLHRGANEPRKSAEEVHAARQAELTKPPSTEVSDYGREELARRVNRMFPLTGMVPERLHELIGAQPGMSAEASPHYSGGIYVSGGGRAVQDKGLGMHRTIEPDAEGSLVAKNLSFGLKKAFRGGTGAKTFAAQVEALANHGVDRLETTAGRGGGMSGYAVWPKFGYDAPLSEWKRAILPAHLSSAKTLADLHEMPGGAEWWKEHGDTTPMSFDLTPGSRSWQRLNAYRESKGLPPISLDAEKIAAVKAARKESHVHDKYAARAQEQGHDPEMVRKAAEEIHASGAAAPHGGETLPRHELLDRAYRLAMFHAEREYQRRFAEANPSPGGEPVAQHRRDDDVDRHEARHAPPGGTRVGGKFYKGGTWIPGAVMAKASPAERAKIEGGAPRHEKKLQGEVPDMKLWKEVESIMPGTRPEELPFRCGEAGGSVVFLVDGEAIKLRRRKDADTSHVGEPDFMDFVEGGNGQEDSELCGPDEVYVDATLLPEAWPFVAYHECHEARDMKGGMSYDAAHERANAGEKALRERAAEGAIPDSEKEHSLMSRVVDLFARALGKDRLKRRRLERDEHGNAAGFVEEWADEADRHVTDAEGHEHKPAGTSEGGQFTGKGGAGKKSPKAHAAHISGLLDQGRGAEALAYFRSLGNAGFRVMSHLDDYAKRGLGEANDAEGAAGFAPAPGQGARPAAGQGDRPTGVEELAKSALEAAAATKTGGFGDNKVFISHVYETLKQKYPGMTLDEFKAWLIEANHARLLNLSRADLVQAMNPEDVEASEAKHLSASFHFIFSPGQRAQTHYDSEAQKRVDKRSLEARHKALEEERKRGGRT